MLNPKSKILNLECGSTLIFTVITIFVFSLVMLAVLNYATTQLRVVRSTVNREQAFQIAEAGVNYYQWRLAHYATDYYDGNASSTSPGPYVHDYYDKDTNQKIGQYSLVVTPPSVGSTIITIQSTGYSVENPKVKRTITVRYGVPSLAKYAFLTNTDVWIGDTESVSGQMHANGGIRFDGSGNAPITSAKSTYTCQSWSGSPCPATKNGIWGSAPASTQALWQFPQPNVDFASMTSDLSSIKSNAQSGGIYLPPSNAQGYSLVFNSNGTISIYKVTSLRSTPTGWDVNGNSHNEDVDYNNRTKLDGNPSVAGVQDYAMPSNGLIYIEDTTWAEGTVKGRVLVAAAKLPYNVNTAPSIIVPNNIVYAAKDGTNSLGLIAQKDFLISYYAPNTLEINAAIIAQNGSAQMWNFGSTRTSLTIYGAVSSFGVWTWSWVSGNTCTSGYCTTQTSYDANLLFAPPPSFPLSSDGYQQISWNSD
jgi:hypothetical protein